MTEQKDHGPGVIAPPIFAAGALLLAWGLHQIVPLRLHAPSLAAGFVVVLAACALAASAMRILLGAGTTLRADRPSTIFVATGPYRFTRNPIYLALLCLVVGIALGWGSLWAWLAVPAVFLILDRYAIAREEPYLAARFGAAYEHYRSRVRRWM